MVEFFISWHAALVFLAALASPGWGAATAGLFIGIEADSWTLPLWAALGGYLRDAALYAWTAAGHWALIRLPKSIQTQLHHAPVATAVGLQSFHLFRWDLAAAAGAGGQPRLRFLAWLTVASVICAYLGQQLHGGSSSCSVPADWASLRLDNRFPASSCSRSWRRKRCALCSSA